MILPRSLQLFGRQTGKSFDPSWFGTGTDEIVVPPGFYPVATDVSIKNLTLTAGVTARLEGITLFCAGTLEIQPGAVITARGNDGVGPVPGDWIPAVIQNAPLQTGGTPGGVGAIGAALPGAGTSFGRLLFSSQYSPAGGDGGSGGVGSVQAGAAGGTISAATTDFEMGEFCTVPRLATRPWMFNPNLAAVVTMGGGFGGGGGGNDNVDSGGGGGGGGGVILLFCNRLINNGLIDASGGNGGNAVGGDSGGGGGGGGGLVLIVTNSYTGSGSILVNGGVGGLPTGLGNQGDNGNQGFSYILLP